MNKVESLLAHIEELDRHATKGPWNADFNPENGEVVRDMEQQEIVELGFSGDGCDLDFIAESRDLLPRLARAIRIILRYIDRESGGTPWLTVVRDIIEQELIGDSNEQG